MKGQDRTMIVIGVIFIILFSVWIVAGDMGKINLWNWVQTIYIFLNMIWDYIYKERTWTIPSLLTIVAILLHISKKHKTSVGSPRKESMEDTFEEEHITTLELEKEDYQALSTYLDKERKDIFHTIAPGSTTLLVGDIVGSDELFIQLPWANYQGKVRSDELVGYLIQVISKGDQILVLGEPGQGKTTVLKRVFTIMADHFLHGSSDVVPLYVTLRDVPYSEDESGETLLLWKYLCKKRNAFPLPYTHFISLLRDNRIIFLFDGFDEITVGLSQCSINKRISSEIFSQLSILSCRRNFYELYLSTSEIQQKYQKYNKSISKKLSYCL
jgi:predicted NACHT family NTPase